MPRTQQEIDDCGRRALAYYHNDIKPQLCEKDDGRYVAVDPDSGVWAISDGEDAVDMLQAKTSVKYPFLLIHPRVWVNSFGGGRSGSRD